MRRSALALFVAFVLAGTTAALSAAAPAPRFSLPGIPNPGVNMRAPEIGKYGGTYIISQISDPRTFNPIVVQDTASGAVTGAFADGLVEQNYITGEIEPSLAESWSVSPDGRTWTFTLREGIVWSDGQPLTTADVEFTAKAIFTPGVDNSFKNLLTFRGEPVRWRVLDRRRIQFMTPRNQPPVGLFLRFIGFPIVPKHKLEAALNAGGQQFTQSWGINANPRDIVGSGPFVLQSYTPGQRVIMLRNPRYWKVDRQGQRLPYLTRYVILVVPNTEAARLKFLARETDAYGARPREFAELKALERQHNFTIYDGPETFTREFLVLNQNPNAPISKTKVAWFSDVRFRRALAHAIDQQTIINQVYAGRATPPTSDVSVGNTLYYNRNLRPYPYDLNRAQQLLAEAGYRKGPDGILRDAQGNVVEFTIVTNAGNQDREAIGNIVRQDFVKLGIRATFTTEAFPSLVGKLTGTYNWEAVIIGFTGGIEPCTARNLWLSSGDLHMWNPNQKQPATAWEAEVDRLFEQCGTEVDQNKRKAILARFQEVVYENLPMLYFPYVKTQPALRNTIGNVKLGLQGVTGELETRYFKGAYRP
jgi:peptide/nickel transport system substrate-binding protein